ncbi:Lrp/AsnC family transcriptional regulator [Pseudomonas kermanshahensis]|uniref:Lrp/AsnC family transcriptional regulator n=1 Tax=Pseudomonas kermanshahensis TaxID=2745482 RepID=UPI0023DB7287|nr:Lrp/AsnC family transcriptional regulator [Pseudomonas kermanshahensis]WEL57535.1 Lrp/AsnC family transcriptional regulator [Pseudomonas kermanshahensis]
MPKLDSIDLKILKALQKNARLSSSELAEEVSLTSSPCWRRVKQLEDSGIITGYHANIDNRQLGYTVKAFVSVTLERMDKQRLEEFELAIRDTPEILSCHRVSGKFDYQLMVVSHDMSTFGDYAKTHINGLPYVKEVYTSFVLDEIKAEVAPPMRSIT